MKIHLSRAGETFGPYTAEHFSKIVEAGNVSPYDHCWIESSEWMPLQDVVTLFSRVISRPIQPPPLPDASFGIASPLTGFAAIAAYHSIQIEQESLEGEQYVDEFEEDFVGLDDGLDADLDFDFDF